MATRTVTNSRNVAPTRSTAGRRLNMRSFGSSSFNWRGNTVEQRIVPTDLTPITLNATTDYSVGAWIHIKQKTVTGDSDSHTFVNCNLNYGGNLGYEIQIRPIIGNLSFYSGNTNYLSGENVVPYNKWCHIAFTLTGTTLKGYVNGALVWTQTITRKADSGNNEGKIGTESTGTGNVRRMAGQMSQFFSTKTLLTAEQIADIYYDGKYPTLDIYYKLDEGTGASAVDSSGNGNTGTITGNSWSTNVPMTTRSTV